MYVENKRNLVKEIMRIRRLASGVTEGVSLRVLEDYARELEREWRSRDVTGSALAWRLPDA